MTNFLGVKFPLTEEESKFLDSYCKIALGVGTASLLTIPIQGKIPSAIRLGLLFPGSIAGCVLLHRYRSPGTLENEYQRVEKVKSDQKESWSEIEKAKTQLQEDHARFIEKYQIQANQQIDHFNQSLNQQREQYEGTIQQLQNQLALANAPKFDSGNKTASWNCNKLINYLWHSHGITCDCEELSQWDYEKERYFLKPRQVKDFKTLKSDDLLSELEAVLNNCGGIETTQKGEILIVEFTPGDDTRSTTAKKSKAAIVAKESTAITAEKTVERGLGYFIAGESGSGKTAVASYIAQLLAKKKPSTIQKRVLLYPDLKACEGIVLDPHNNPIWGEIGLKVISSPFKILETLELIYEEYKERKENGKKGNKLLVFVDEFEELLAEMGKDLRASGLKKTEVNQKLDEVVDCVRSLATGGRKFCISPIIMNQSWNCSALKLDSNHRNNFVGIFLNTAGDNYIQQKCGSQSFEPLRKWMFEERKDRYRGVVCGAFSPQPFLHPTHHQYNDILDGQKPKDLNPVQWLTLSIDFSCKQNEQLTVSTPPENPVTDGYKQSEGYRIPEEYGNAVTVNIEDGYAVTDSVADNPKDLENRGEKFLELRNLRESGVSKSNIVKEHWGMSGRHFQEGIKEYESLISEFAFSWISDLIHAQELTEKKIFELVYSPNKSNKDKLKRLKAQYQEVLDRIGNSIGE